MKTGDVRTVVAVGEGGIIGRIFPTRYPVGMDHLLDANLDDLIEHLQAVRSLAQPLEQAAVLVRDCLLGGHKLLICGNGGSAADAAHIATEFVCRYHRDRQPYPAIALADSGSTLTAIGNDYDFDQVFARQVHAFGQTGDILMVLTTSGQSPDVHLALEAARQRGLDSIAFLGRDGGSCRGLATVQLLVGGTLSARIQEVHKLLYHTLCEMIEPDLIAGGE